MKNKGTHFLLNLSETLYNNFLSVLVAPKKKKKRSEFNYIELITMLEELVAPIDTLILFSIKILIQ